MAGDEATGTGAPAVPVDGVLYGLGDSRIGGKAEVVVAGEVDGLGAGVETDDAAGWGFDGSQLAVQAAVSQLIQLFLEELPVQLQC